MNDMIYLCCDKTFKLSSFKIGQAKLGITPIVLLDCNIGLPKLEILSHLHTPLLNIIQQIHN